MARVLRSRSLARLAFERVAQASSTIELVNDNALQCFQALPSDSFDAVVTDPPYGLGGREPTADELLAFIADTATLDTGGDFLGTSWSIPPVALWREAYRVLKPGGYLLASAGPRTAYLITLGLRCAGFEIRDSIAWVFGQGWPKNSDVTKNIDRHLGADRKVVGKRRVSNAAQKAGGFGGGNPIGGNVRAGDVDVTEPSSEQAKLFAGWGLQLKPAHEPIIVARKPLVAEGLVETLRRHGTGALHADACRVPTDWDEADRPASWKRSGHSAKPDDAKIAAPAGNGIKCHPLGRYPTNIVFGQQAAVDLDEQAGNRKSGARRAGARTVGCGYNGGAGDGGPAIESSQGPASRFFPVIPPDEQEPGPAVVTPDELAEHAFEPGQCYAIDDDTMFSIVAQEADGWRLRYVDGSTGFAHEVDLGDCRLLGIGSIVDDAVNQRDVFVPSLPLDDAPQFLYAAKAPKGERSAGCEAFLWVRDKSVGMGWRPATKAEWNATRAKDRAIGNPHPCVKPLALVRWLVRLVARPGALICDPFTGSGTTLIAALLEGVRAVGFELDGYAVMIAQARLAHWTARQAEGRVPAVQARRVAPAAKAAEQSTVSSAAAPSESGNASPAAARSRRRRETGSAAQGVLFG